MHLTHTDWAFTPLLDEQSAATLMMKHECRGKSTVRKRTLCFVLRTLLTVRASAQLNTVSGVDENITKSGKALVAQVTIYHN